MLNTCTKSVGKYRLNNVSASDKMFTCSCFSRNTTIYYGPVYYVSLLQTNYSNYCNYQTEFLLTP